MNYDELLKRLPKAKNMADGYALYQRYLQDRFDKEKQEYVPNQMPRDDVQKYTSRILALYQLSEEAKEKKSNVDFKETDGKKRFDEIQSGQLVSEEGFCFFIDRITKEPAFYELELMVLNHHLRNEVPLLI